MLNVKIVERIDIDVILEILNEENDKIMHGVILFKLKKGQKREGEPENDAVAIFGVFRERMTSLFLDSRLIRPSEFFGARRKVVLCSKAYAWTPVLGSFDKLREVENLSYLVYF